MRYTVKVENVAFSKHTPCYILKICVIDINGFKENYIVPVDSKADVERLIKAVNNVKEEVKNESNDQFYEIHCRIAQKNDGRC